MDREDFLGGTITYQPPSFGGRLLTLDGRAAAPFDLVVDGTFSLNATLSAGTTAKQDGPLVEFSSDDGDRLGFAAVGGWNPTIGVSYSAPSISLALDWPSINASTAQFEVPFFSFGGSASVTRRFIEAGARAQILASVATSPLDIGAWLLARRWVSPYTQAASLAQYLIAHSQDFIAVYGAVLDLQALQEKVEAILAQVRPIAATISGVADRLAALVGPFITALRVAKAVAVRFVSMIREGVRAVYNTVVDTVGSVIDTIGSAFGFIASEATAKPMRAGLERPLLTRRTLNGSALRLAAVSRLRKRSLPRSLYRAGAASALGAGMKVRIGPLLTSARRVKRGRSVSAAAVLLPGKRAYVTLVGTKYAAERQVTIREGIAGATVKVPKKIRPGYYYLAIADLSAATPTEPGLLALTRIRVTR